MTKYYKDKTVKPWRLLACIVVLGISSYAFYLFVSPRTQKVIPTETTPLTTLERAKQKTNGGELSSSRSGRLTNEEFVALMRDKDEELLRRVRGGKKKRGRSRRAFAQSTNPIQKWEEQVAQLRNDLKAASDHPELAKDIKKKLDNAIAEKPIR
jgi:hypothetical protein